jgi:hypothetical protein
MNSPARPIEPAMTLTEVCAVLGVSKRTFRRRADAGTPLVPPIAGTTNRFEPARVREAMHRTALGSPRCRRVSHTTTVRRAEGPRQSRVMTDADPCHAN